MAMRWLFGRTVFLLSTYKHMYYRCQHITKSMTRFGKSLNLITIIRKNTLPTDQINIFKTVVVLYIHTTIKLIDMFILSLFKPNGGQEI